MVQKLKEKYEETYKADEIHWMQWASQISVAAAHCRDEVFNSGPPRDLLRYFESAQRSSADRITNDVGIARRLNSGTLRALQVFNTRLQTFQTNTQNAIKDLQDELSGLIRDHGSREFTLSAVSDHVRPIETEISREIFDSIPNRLDEDHVYEENAE